MKARHALWFLLAILIVAVAGAGLYGWSRKAQLDLGTGYAARVACGCRYMGNRPLASCYRDFEPGMEVIGLSENSATRTITASVPLIASRAVTFDPVLGCQPEPFTGTPHKVKQ